MKKKKRKRWKLSVEKEEPFASLYKEIQIAIERAFLKHVEDEPLTMELLVELTNLRGRLAGFLFAHELTRTIAAMREEEVQAAFDVWLHCGLEESWPIVKRLDEFVKQLGEDLPFTVGDAADHPPTVH